MQGSGGRMAAGALVPEEHHVRAVREGRRQQGRRRRQVLAGSRRRRRVREGEPGRRAVPAQGGPQDVQELPGAVQGSREDVQLLHHWYLLPHLSTQHIIMHEFIFFIKFTKLKEYQTNIQSL